jgi:hypothetical protein
MVGITPNHYMSFNSINKKKHVFLIWLASPPTTIWGGWTT